jgi:hypothetical protein
MELKKYQFPYFEIAQNFTNQFRLVLSTLFLLNQSKSEIMETLWCMKKNDIRELIYHRDIPIALTPCLKAECAI